MQRYYGGTKVRAGFYLNPRTWKIEPISGKGGILPGDVDSSYVKVPMLLVVLGAPLSGLLYVITLPIFLPLIGLGMVFSFLAQKVYRLAPRPVSELVNKSRSNNLGLSIDPHLGLVYPDGGLPIEDEDEDDR